MRLGVKHSIMKNTISVIVIISFVFTSIPSYAYNRPTLFKEKSQAQKYIQEEKQAVVDILKDPSAIDINKKYGKVLEWHKGEKSDKLIIHIQDRHVDEIAQTNIASLIGEITQKYNFYLLSLEGASGELDTSFYDKLADIPTKEKVARFFVKKGLFTGSEYYKITHKEQYLKASGAESKKLYLSHLNSYKENQIDKESALSFIKAIRASLDELKGKVYSKELKELDAKSSAYKNGNINLADYAITLSDFAANAKIDLAGYPDVSAFSVLVKKEKAIDFAKAQKQREAAIKALSESPEKEKVKELLRKSLEFKLSKITDREFYSYLKQLLKVKDSGMQQAEYKDLYAYIDYIEYSASIDYLGLFTELDLLEQKTINILCKNQKQQKLAAYSKAAAMLEELYALKLTNEKVEYINLHGESFNIKAMQVFIKEQNEQYGLNISPAVFTAHVDQKAFDNSIKFYEIAIKRDTALVENTLSSIEKFRKDRAILVTGGFHTAGITNILKQKGISYVVICPNVGDGDCEKIYQDRMARKIPDVAEMAEFFKQTLSAPLVTSDVDVVGAELARHVEATFAELCALTGQVLSAEEKTAILARLSTIAEGIGVLTPEILEQAIKDVMQERSLALAEAYRPREPTAEGAKPMPQEEKEPVISYESLKPKKEEKGRALAVRIASVLKEQNPDKNKLAEYQRLAEIGWATLSHPKHIVYLNDKGQKVRSEFENMLLNYKKAGFWTQSNFDAFKKLIKQMPTVERPNENLFVDVFAGWDDEKLKLLVASSYRRGIQFNLTDGCSNRCTFCTIGDEARPLEHMPFVFAIKIMKRIHKLLESYGSELIPYFDSEPFDYYDDATGARISDVVRHAKEIGYRKINIVTHGLGGRRAEDTREIASELETPFEISFHVFHHDVIEFLRMKKEGKLSEPEAEKHRGALIAKYSSRFIPLMQGALASKAEFTIRGFHTWDIPPEMEREISFIESKVWENVERSVGKSALEKRGIYIEKAPVAWINRAALMLKNLGMPEDKIKRLRGTSASAGYFEKDYFVSIGADGRLTALLREGAGMGEHGGYVLEDTQFRTVKELFGSYDSEAFKVFLMLLRFIATVKSQELDRPVFKPQELDAELLDFVTQLLKNDPKNKPYISGLTLPQDIEYVTLGAERQPPKASLNYYKLLFEFNSFKGLLPLLKNLNDKNIQKAYNLLRDVPIIPYLGVRINCQGKGKSRDTVLMSVYNFTEPDNPVLQRDLYNFFRRFTLADRVFIPAQEGVKPMPQEELEGEKTFPAFSDYLRQTDPRAMHDKKILRLIAPLIEAIEYAEPLAADVEEDYGDLMDEVKKLLEEFGIYRLREITNEGHRLTRGKTMEQVRGDPELVRKLNTLELERQGIRNRNESRQVENAKTLAGLIKNLILNREVYNKEYDDNLLTAISEMEANLTPHDFDTINRKVYETARKHELTQGQEVALLSASLLFMPAYVRSALYGEGIISQLPEGEKAYPLEEPEGIFQYQFIAAAGTTPRAIDNLELTGKLRATGFLQFVFYKTEDGDTGIIFGEPKTLHSDIVNAIPARAVYVKGILTASGLQFGGIFGKDIEEVSRADIDSMHEMQQAFTDSIAENGITRTDAVKIENKQSAVLFINPITGKVAYFREKREAQQSHIEIINELNEQLRLDILALAAKNAQGQRTQQPRYILKRLNDETNGSIYTVNADGTIKINSRAYEEKIDSLAAQLVNAAGNVPLVDRNYSNLYTIIYGEAHMPGAEGKTGEPVPVIVTQFDAPQRFEDFSVSSVELYKALTTLPHLRGRKIVSGFYSQEGRLVEFPDIPLMDDMVVYLQDSEKAQSKYKAILGGKGANIGEMNTLNIPVPNGFVVTTNMYRAWLANGKKLNEEMKAIILRAMEEAGLLQNGALDVSVRSSAALSMPGMLDTKKEIKSLDELYDAVEKVFNSCDSRRATAYRRAGNIPDSIGTAVVIQKMIYGNFNDKSLTGVIFSQNTKTGEDKIYGEYLEGAPGEELVSGGARKSGKPILSIDSLRDNKKYPSLYSRKYPGLYRMLKLYAERLEAHFGYPQEIEFTVENGTLYILQTRNAKATPVATIRMLNNLVSRQEVQTPAVKQKAFETVRPLLKYLSVASVDKESVEIGDELAKAIAVFPGAASGAIVFSEQDKEAQLEKVRRHKREGKNVIFVAEETSVEDVETFRAADGVVTLTGGETSHAANIARALNKPCIVGAESLVLVEANGQRALTYKDRNLAGFIFSGQAGIPESDILTIDGSDGIIYHGQQKINPPEIDESEYSALKTFDDAVTFVDRYFPLTDLQKIPGKAVKGLVTSRTESAPVTFFPRGEILKFVVSQRAVSAFASAATLHENIHVEGTPIVEGVLNPSTRKIEIRPTDASRGKPELLQDAVNVFKTKLETDKNIGPHLNGFTFSGAGILQEVFRYRPTEGVKPMPDEEPLPQGLQVIAERLETTPRLNADQREAAVQLLRSNAEVITEVLAARADLGDLVIEALIARIITKVRTGQTQLFTPQEQAVRPQDSVKEFPQDTYEALFNVTSQLLQGKNSRFNAIFGETPGQIGLFIDTDTVLTKYDRDTLKQIAGKTTTRGEPKFKVVTLTQAGKRELEEKLGFKPENVTTLDDYLSDRGFNLSEFAETDITEKLAAAAETMKAQIGARQPVGIAVGRSVTIAGKEINIDVDRLADKVKAKEGVFVCSAQLPNTDIRIGSTAISKEKAILFQPMFASLLGAFNGYIENPDGSYPILIMLPAITDPEFTKRMGELVRNIELIASQA